VDVLAIGCSTGGPNALHEIIGGLRAPLPVPVVIVQHMPPVFTRLLAERLHARGTMTVREGSDGARLTPGEVLIAPGDHHMRVVRDGTHLRVALDQGPPENSCRPAVDVLFRSLAALDGVSVLAVVLTGMGRDGLRGCELLREASGDVLAQDEATSVVWGMPGFVARAGLASAVLPLPSIGAEIERRVRWRTT
jgi:two-component system chemotaxis response regulator CheB